MVDRKTNDVAGDHMAELIDGIYEVAVDPARYESLVDIWERRLGPLRSGAGQSFSDAVLEQHAARAWLFLDRYDQIAGRRGVNAALAELGRTAAFASRDGRTVVAANEAAGQLFQLRVGQRLTALPIQPEEAEALSKAIRSISVSKQDASTVLRARSTRTGGPIIFRIRPVIDEEVQSALVATSEFAWPQGLTDTMREAFDLTLAEVEVVRSITEGQSPKEIAESRGRSLDTVRTQMRSILAKTETHSQSELVRVTIALMDVVEHAISRQGRGLKAASDLKDIPYRSVTLTDGRRLDYIEFGDPAGRACVYFPLDYGLIRWPASAEAAAERRHLRVIVPIRAGFGHSSPMPAGINYTKSTADDAAQLLRQLGVEKAVAITLGADLRFAMKLALLKPGLLTGILGCAAMLPVQTAEQYDRMDKWHRFILANGRYAPRLLPFLVKAGYSMARRLGKDRFFTAVNAGSPADLRTFEIPEVRQAILSGSDVCLSDWHSSHEAFAREVIDSETNWSDLIQQCTIPVKLLQGDQDPQSPVQTIRELAAGFPKLDVQYLEGAGQLLFFQEWPLALNELEKLINAGDFKRHTQNGV